ncbi:hypothetical protein [Geotalea daltonii]|nr:hypothetical protein [Geotalea daltonii]
MLLFAVIGLQRKILTSAEVKGNRGVEISLDQMDALIERTMQVARHRSGL